MAEPRRVVLADPLGGAGGRTRFAVAGQGAPGAPGDVKMYEWDGLAENMNMVGLQTDVGSGIKRHLLCLGLSTGRVHLITLSPSSLTLPLRGTPAPAGVLGIKHSRSVTSLAFSSHDPNLLAVGYERHRSDHSLLIWDISDTIGSFPPDPDGERGYVRPPQRLEATNTAAAAHDSPRHLQQYCPSEVVHSVAWMPGSGAELYASANNKAVRLYDLRQPTRDAGATGPVQWATRAVHHLTPDPALPTRIASVEANQYGGVVRLWDARKPGQEVSFLEVPEGSTIVGLEWAQGSAEIAIGTREGGVKISRVVNGPQRYDGSYEWVSMGDVRHVVKTKQQLHSFAFAPSNTPEHRDIVFVVKDGRIGVGPIGRAPALAASSRGELALATSSCIQVLDPTQDVHTTRVTPDTSRMQSQAHSRAPSPRRNSTDERRKNRFQLAPERVSALLVAEREHVRSRSASPSLIRGRGSRRDLPSLVDEMDDYDRQYYEKQFPDEITDSDGTRMVMRHDIAYVMAARAEQGYGLDNLLLNAAVATRFPNAGRIAGIWEFVDHFVRATTPDVSNYLGYNLTYQGLYSIWNGLGTVDGQPQRSTVGLPHDSPHSLPHSHTHSPASGATTPRRAGTLDTHDAQYITAVAHINALRADKSAIAAPGSHRLPHTDRAPLRRMMLAVCGENHAYDTMEEVHRLVDDNQRTKAACWAFFAGEEEPAVKILMRSVDEKHRLMGTTIAGFMTQSSAARGSLFWQEHWRSMVDKVDDPYVRAVLARIAGENWDGILYDEGLPLLDRVAVAVCNLSDKDLTAFLANRLERTVQQGALPGLALTGFTPAGLTLLQKFVDRTSDIQTAALLAAFFPRAHLSPAQLRTVDRWTETYRSYLDSWVAWVPRCSLDVALQDQRRAIGDAPAESIQTVVVCPVCNAQLTKQAEELLMRKNALRGTIRAPTVRTTTCIYCQNALPRCAVCLLHVTPTSDVEQNQPDAMGGAFVSCQTCRHGGHVTHILGWFEGGLDGEPAHDVCPVAECGCRCASL